MKFLSEQFHALEVILREPNVADVINRLVFDDRIVKINGKLFVETNEPITVNFFYPKVCTFDSVTCLQYIFADYHLDKKTYTCTEVSGEPRSTLANLTHLTAEEDTGKIQSVLFVIRTVDFNISGQAKTNVATNTKDK